MLRDRGAGAQRVTPLELFFDLVYVFAINQLSHLLLDHPTVGGGSGDTLIAGAKLTGQDRVRYPSATGAPMVLIGIARRVAVYALTAAYDCAPALAVAPILRW